MKQSILFLFVFVSLISCQKSREEKIAELVKENLCTSLYFPESYDPAETKIDSAFSPYDSPEIFEKFQEVAEIGIEIENENNELKLAKSKMALWADPFDSYGRNEYNEAKKEYNSKQQKIEEMTQKVRDIFESIKYEFQKKPVFIGYKVQHKYRAKNNNGDIVFGQQEFIINPELTSVLASYDMDSESYKGSIYIIEGLKKNINSNAVVSE